MSTWAIVCLVWLVFDIMVLIYAIADHCYYAYDLPSKFRMLFDAITEDE